MTIEHFTIDDFKEGTEFYTAVMSGESIIAKALSTEEKTELIRQCLLHEEIVNPSLITNIVLLSLGGSLDDNAFKNEICLFNSLIEFIDIKQELRTEINKFNTQLCKYFIGVLKGYSLKLNELKIDITNLYWGVIHSVTFANISTLLNKVDFNIKDVPAIRNAEEIIDSLCIKNNVSKELMNILFGSGLIEQEAE